jgi:hypothetical protein
MADARQDASVALSETEIRNAQMACQALAVEYAEVVDNKDYERLRDVFAEDASFGRPFNPKESIHGIEAIIAMFASRPPNRLTHHIVSNFRLHVETRDRAIGTCRVLLYTSDSSESESPEGRPVSGPQLMGTYQDLYLRTPKGWRLADRRGSIAFHT